MAGEFSSFTSVSRVITPIEPIGPVGPPPSSSLPPEESEEDLTIETISAGLAIQIDEVSDTVTYVGRAQPGSLVSSPVWQIQRLTEVGDDLAVQWAQGTADFARVWDDRLSYVYS